MQPFEIVVSDDSSPERAEETRQVAAAYDAIYQTGPRRGLYANRNAVALACRGTHIRTMDDDHTFPVDHFLICRDAMLRDPVAIWACDEIGFLDGKFHAGPSPAPQLHPSGVGGPVSDPDNCWAIADGSTIYPREAFQQGRRMIEDFGYGSSYLEFGAYLYRQGFRSRLLRTTHIRHLAESATLGRPALASRLYASLCFNLYFRKNVVRAAKYTFLYTMRSPAECARLALILRSLHRRWAPLYGPVMKTPRAA